MPGVALLVFREVLEAALIISIVCAATRGVPRRGPFVIGGIRLGVAGPRVGAGASGLVAEHPGGCAPVVA